MSKTRRIFLKQSALTTAGLALGSQTIGMPFKSGIMGSNEKVRVGFLVEPVHQKLKGNAEFGDLGSKENSTGNLIRNFLDCIKEGGEPLCSLEDGHRSTSFAHLANISLEMGQRIEWDAVNERITNSKKANDYLHYEYRAPWKL
ncbi:MAG: twin-arginine translocation signal domain-containing protein [Cytophagales bacterium]|nr:twin-arginine translocation signal domain-containing protein [Cytophagales bacterium]